MAKGNEAKAALIKRFAAAVGADYLGEQDKKYYFNSKENGEVVQVAVSLTCPKTPVVFNGRGGDLNFDDDEPGAAAAAPVGTSPVEMTEDEQATLERLMKELDL